MNGRNHPVASGLALGMLVVAAACASGRPDVPPVAGSSEDPTVWSVPFAPPTQSDVRVDIDA